MIDGISKGGTTIKKNKLTYIMNIEAKDLTIAGDTYTSKTKDNKINFKRYKASLDYSLEVIKLESVAQSVFKTQRDKNIIFVNKGKQYTNSIINITFNYSVRQFNEVKKDKYACFGHSIDNIVFKDGIALNTDNEIIGIDTGVEVLNAIDKLPRGFGFENSKYIVDRNKIKTLVKTDALRHKLYTEGFICDGKKYVRFKRSSGSSRVGKCLFIDERLYKPTMQWSMMGLNYKQSDNIDLAAIEAYIALTTSSIIDTLQLEPKNILLIDDYISTFEDTVMATKVNSQNELETKKEKVQISNNIWDGQSLLDVSLFEERYADKGMLLLRNRFFKSACFNTNIQQFFKDNKITSIEQLNGKTNATDINDIKLITTPSSIKYLKFGTYKEWLNQLDTTFGIVKYDKPTYFFDGELVQTHYQLLNTLQLTKKEVEEFLKPTFEYIKLLKNDIRVFREHLKVRIKDDVPDRDINSTSEMIFTMLEINNRFIHTDMFVNFKGEVIKSYINNLRKGHVLVKGNYSTLFGNGFEMLKASINDFNGKSILGIDEVYNTNFEFGEELLGCRSPHVTMSNLWICKNVDNKYIKKYFNLSKQIICINSINNNILERLSSADFDSDQILLTNSQILIQSAKANYDKFLVPTSLVEAKKVSRQNTLEQRADLDIKTSVNKIGEIINCSQELNSKLWDRANNGESIDSDSIQSLFADISQLDVMSCIEIDKAKKEFVIDNTKELEKIRNKYRDKIMSKDKEVVLKPKFLGVIAKSKNYNINFNKTKAYVHHKTTMDYLQQCINSGLKDCRMKHRSSKNGEIIALWQLINGNSEDVNIIDANRRISESILDKCLNFRNATIDIWNGNGENIEKYNQAKEIKNNFIDDVKNTIITKETMKKIIKDLLINERYNSLGRTMFNILYHAKKDVFIELLSENKEAVESIVKTDSTKHLKRLINLYGIEYEIVKN